jgi:hypothetical protein
VIVVRNGSVTPSVTGWRPVAFGVSAAAFSAWTAAARSARAEAVACARAFALTESSAATSPSVRADSASAGPDALRYLPTAWSKQPERSSASSAFVRSLQSTRWAWSSGLLMMSRIRSFCQ